MSFSLQDHLIGWNSCSVSIIAPPVGLADPLQGFNWVVLITNSLKLITIAPLKVDYKIHQVVWLILLSFSSVYINAADHQLALTLGNPQHSQCGALLSDSGKKIKLPDLFSLVPWTLSGGFKPFNWALWTENCKADYQQHVHFSEL